MAKCGWTHELDEDPNQAAIREVKEEVGLDVKLYESNLLYLGKDTSKKELIPPISMNIHKIDEAHRHVALEYFAKAKNDRIIQPKNAEKSQCRWLTREEIKAMPGLEDHVRFYALKALELVG